MSTGRLGDFADDPGSVFVDVPPNPRWIGLLDAGVTVSALAGSYVVARSFGASGTVAALAGVAGAAVFGFKLSVLARHRRVPRLTVADFDAIRAAGSRALAQLRAAQPELAEVGWSWITTAPDGWVIRLHGRKAASVLRTVDTTRTYLIPRDGGEPRELPAEAHPRSSYSQRVVRAACASGDG